MTGHHPLLKPLTKEIITEHISELIEMSKQLQGDYWMLDHYLSELNRKWELSKAVFSAEGQFIAFVIVSEKPESLHVHRIVVVKEYLGQGLGKVLIGTVKEEAIRSNKNAITLKAEADNPQSLGFYKGLNFEITGQQGALVLMTLKIAL